MSSATVVESVSTIYKYLSNQWNIIFANKPKLETVSKIIAISSVYLISRKICYALYWKYKKYPPGAIGLPFLGILFSMRPNNIRSININIAKQYGPVAMVQIGPIRNSIIINDFDLYYKHFKNKEFSFRPKAWTKRIYDIPPNFSLIHGKQWAVRRKLLYSSLLKITDSKYITKYVQNNIKNKIIMPSIEDSINNKSGKWFLRKPLINFAFNTLFGASFGPKLMIGINDEKYKRFQALSKQSDDTFLYLLIMTYFGDFAVDLVYKIIGQKNILLETRNILNQWIDEYPKNMQNINNSNDEDAKFQSYVEIMLNDKNIDRETVIADIAAVFVAGTNTTRQSIELAILAAAKYPDIQTKIYTELRDIFDDSDDINIQNMSQLNQAHYLRALIEECWRTRDIGGLPRALQKDYKLDFIDSNGNKDYYILPKGCFVAYNNIYNARNNNIWRNGVEFDVYNYLDDNNKFIKSLAKNKNDIRSKYSVFGYGTRQCAGIALARKQVLFCVATLLYKYQFHGPKGKGDTDFCIPGLVNGLATKEVPVTVTKR